MGGKASADDAHRAQALKRDDLVDEGDVRALKGGEVDGLVDLARQRLQTRMDIRDQGAPGGLGHAQNLGPIR